MATTLLALMLLFGSHEAGHQLEADKQGVTLDWRYYRGVTATIQSRAPDKIAAIAGGGFVMQDELAAHYEGLPMYRQYRLLSAVSKLSYIIMPHSISNYKNGGDVHLIRKYKGASMLEEALIISAIADIVKAYRPDSRWDVMYWQSRSGTPGLKIKVRM